MLLKERELKLMRKLPRKSKLSVLHQFYSHKNHCSFRFESALEAHSALCLEFDANVARYVAQPFSVTYSLNGRNVRYTPDFLVQLTNGRFKSQEIKPSEKLASPKNQRKFQTLQAYFAQSLHHPLELVDEKFIYRGHKVNNFQRLYPYLQRQPSATELQTLNGLPCQQLSFGELVGHLAEHVQEPLHSALTLVALGFFDWNETLLIDENSTLTLKSGVA